MLPTFASPTPPGLRAEDEARFALRRRLDLSLNAQGRLAQGGRLHPGAHLMAAIAPPLCALFPDVLFECGGAPEDYFVSYSKYLNLSQVLIDTNINTSNFDQAILKHCAVCTPIVSNDFNDTSFTVGIVSELTDQEVIMKLPPNIYAYDVGMDLSSITFSNNSNPTYNTNLYTKYSMLTDDWQDITRSPDIGHFLYVFAFLDSVRPSLQRAFKARRSAIFDAALE